MTPNRFHPPIHPIALSFDDSVFGITFKHQAGFEFSKQEDVASNADVYYGFWSKSQNGAEFDAKEAVEVVSNGDAPQVLRALIEREDFKGGSGQVVDDRLSNSGRVGAFGLGNARKDRHANVYSSGLALGRHVKKSKAENCVFIFPSDTDCDELTSFIWRFLFGLYDDNRYKGAQKDQTEPLKHVLVVSGTGLGEFDEIVRKAQAWLRGSVLSVTITDAPPNYCNCVSFAELIEKTFANVPNTEVKIYDEAWCAEQGMGAFLGVLQGSYFGGRMIHVKYCNGPVTKGIAYVGKGITLDTGGLDIKSAQGMLQMKCDKGGAGAVMGAALAMADLAPEGIEAHFIAMVCDNAVSDRAMYPRDVLTASNGKTIEITNTDAEGRLILADGLVYADKLLSEVPGPSVIVDVATLTGAALIALGAEMACVYSNDISTRSTIVDCARRYGEPVWPMPLWDNYKDLLASKVADLQNVVINGGYGGSLIAGSFLEAFVEPETLWVHIDAAGPLWDFKDNKATGWGIAMLTDFAMRI